MRFLVEYTLRGDRNKLKEYTIGVELFERGASFDPRIDPIVRVEASRLRSRLKKYYEGEGLNDEILIELPPGGYVASFAGRTADASAALAESPTADIPPRPYRASKLAPIAVACLTLAAIPMLLNFRRPRQSTAIAREGAFLRLTEDGESRFPTISPDGQFVVFARKKSGNWDIFSRRVGSQTSIDLTADSPSDDLQPAYSPDGRWIAFRSERSGGGIYMMPADGGDARRLSEFGYHPAWSPDGNEVVFASHDFTDPEERPVGRSQLWSVNIGSGEKSPRTDGRLNNNCAFQPSWSPHGHRIAYWGVDQHGNRDIWTVATGTKLTSAVPVTKDAWVDWSPSWGPEGRYLYFSSNRGGSMNLWRVGIDEQSGRILGEPEPITTPSPYSAFSSLSRDGRRMAYARHLFAGNLQKIGFDPDAEAVVGSAVPLTTGLRRIREPDPSPDGEWIVVRVQDPQEDLAILRTNGTEMRRLTNDIYKDRIARWSPDGKNIAFVSNRSGLYEMWVIEPNGGGLRQITSTGALSEAWDPGGTRIAYSADNGTFLLRIQQPGAGLLPLAAPLGGLSNTIFTPFSWSADGKRIAGHGRAGRVLVYSVETHGYKELTFGSNPVWLKDSRRILVRSPNEMFVVDTDTNRSRRIFSSGDGEILGRFSVSKNDRWIYFVLSKSEDDIWVAELNAIVK